MSDGIQHDPIPERELIADYFDNLHRAYAALRSAFRFSGLTQDLLARLLGNADKGQISRWLSGKQNLTLKTLSRMASAMKCALIIEFRPFDQIAAPQNTGNYFNTNDPTPQKAGTTQGIVRIGNFINVSTTPRR
jgi:transcriptional regulator with XRE-family HTH domain